MGRSALWTAILDTLSDEIAQGHYAPGDRLPTEAQLAERFAVNRHTVRRALAALSEQGIIHSKRGAGVFVRHVPTSYPIGRRVRFHQNLLAAGHVPERRPLHFETRVGNARECSALRLVEKATVHVHEGISLSDGAPIAVFRSVFPAERLPGMLEMLRDTQSVTQAFAAHGIADYTREKTEITAAAATRTQAELLELRQGDPVLRAVSVNVDAQAMPIEFGRSWFAADRVTLTLEGA